jgi:hypothetical protein
MPTITYRASHFPPGGPRGTLDIATPWAGLLWAAITVGKWRDDLFIHGRYSLFEATYRANVLWAYLRTDSSDRVLRTDAYQALDPTEKSGVSYSLGMTTTKLFASARLGVPWLMHLDRYQRAFGVSLRPGRSRPDLIGPSDPDGQMRWIVAEAKGRTNQLESDAIPKMRSQKRRVLSIAGTRPTLSIGAAAHFSSDELAVEVVDPPTRGRAGREVFREHADPKRRFVDAYYAPFIALLERSAVNHEGLVMRELPDADVWVAMNHQRLSAIREYLRGERPALTLTEPASEPDLEIPVDRGDTFAGKDGVILRVGASWNDEVMQRPPRERATA